VHPRASETLRAVPTRCPWNSGFAGSSSAVLQGLPPIVTPAQPMAYQVPVLTVAKGTARIHRAGQAQTLSMYRRKPSGAGAMSRLRRQTYS
jgi:hypothetical protein